MVEALLINNATKNDQLILAAENGNSQNGIRIQPTNIFKRIFFSFIFSDNQKTVELLLKNGDDVDSKNDKGDTALNIAANKGNFQFQKSKIN